MIFKVKNNILDVILDKLPFLRYNDTQFLYREEQLYGNIILRRIEGKLDIIGDFEKEPNVFESLCEGFFDPKLSKTFENTKNYLFVGSTLNDLKVTAIPDWNVIAELFKKINLSCKLSYSRYIISIPCGMLNLNIVKFDKDNDIYLEILNFNKDENIEKIRNLLNLEKPLDKEWIDIAKEKIKC